MASTAEQNPVSSSSGSVKKLLFALLGMLLLSLGVFIITLSFVLPVYLYAAAGGPGGLVAAGLIPPFWLFAFALLAGGLAALRKGQENRVRRSRL